MAGRSPLSIFDLAVMFYVVVSFLLLCVVLAALRDTVRKHTSRLPPGPPGLPILGNALQLPAKFLWYKLHHWSLQHGPFYTVWIMGKPMVVLDSVEVAADILDRMSGITSGRPRSAKGETRSMFISGDISPQWLAARRAVHSMLNIRSVSQFDQAQMEEAQHLVLGLLQHPSKSLGDHANRFSESLIFRTLYGGEPFNHLGEDPSRIMEELQNEMLYATSFRNSRLLSLPLLKPLVERIRTLRGVEVEDWYQRTAREGYRLYDAASNEGGPNIVKDFRLNIQKYGLSKHDAVWVTVALYMAGQGTTRTALRVMILALLHNREVIRAAQEQLDTVCGTRPPTWADRQKLPYIEAIVKETIRWSPGLPIGVPHKALEDFEYRGYIIPKGTTLFDNIWGQTRDSTVYPNAEAFDPSRFLHTSANTQRKARDSRLDLHAFGHGRRVCPGMHFAMSTLFIAAATLLWAFNLDWPVDEHGNKVICGVDKLEDHAGIQSTPKQFEAVFTPRQEELEEKLREALDGDCK